jgi:hypothetical protein
VFGEPLVDVTRRQHRRVDQLDAECYLCLSNVVAPAVSVLVIGANKTCPDIPSLSPSSEQRRRLGSFDISSPLG